MASNGTPVTVEQFNAFVETLVENLNGAHTYIYQRLDVIETKMSGLDERAKRLEHTMSDVQTNVTSVKRDTTLLPPMFEMLEQDGVEIATLRTKVEKMWK